MGEEEEYTLEKSFMERNATFNGRNSRSPEVARQWREREEKKERRRRKKELNRTVMP
jgi:hypothetical protein